LELEICIYCQHEGKSKSKPLELGLGNFHILPTGRQIKIQTFAWVAGSFYSH
jgi:hypothetical protein